MLNKVNHKTVSQGFTLVELVTVVLLISILAVSVAPKFDGTASYEAHTHRAQLIAALRLTQQRAMQQTDSSDSYCNHIVFEKSANYTRYGVPDRIDCNNLTFPTPTPIEDWVPDATGHLVDSRYQITFNMVKDDVILTNPTIVSFDWMGVPKGNCAGGCEINVSSSVDTLKIYIEEEGYINVFDFIH